MDYGIAQGLERATGNLAATGMKLMEFQANKQLAADKMAFEREKFDEEKKTQVIQRNAADAQLKDIQYQNERLDLEDTLSNLKLTPRAAEIARKELSLYTEDGLTTNPDGTKRKLFRRKYGTKVLDDFMKNPQKQLEVDKATLQDYQDEIETLKSTIPPDADSEDKKVQAILTKIGALSKQRQQMENHVLDQEEKLFPEQTAILPEGATLVKKSTGATVATGTKKTAKSMTDNEIIAAALKGDKEASAILNKKQEMRNENARESRSQPQQTQFIDPASGNPLIYDRATNTYKVATVEGAGGAAPRMVNPSAGEREKGAQLETIRDQLKRIKSEYKSRYVGLVSGRLGLVTQFTDADEAAFRQVILDVKDSLLRARSGAQINEAEYKRLSKLVPDFNDSEKMFEGKMKSFETTFNTIVSEREKAQRKGGVYIRKDNTPKLPEGLKAGW